MFDLATRPQPQAANAAAVFGVPFDWRMLQPAPVADYPYTDLLQPNGLPLPQVDRLATYALELEDTLQSAIIISLFSDARATDDDVLPAGVTDRRGWVGDEFGATDFDARPDAWGSRLWLYYSGKVTGQVLEGARFAAQESLQWLIREGIASRVTVATQWTGERGDRLAVRPTIYKPGQTTPIYDVLWGTSISRSVQ